MTAPIRAGARIAVGVFALAIAAFLFAWAMSRNLNHDEHQFIAPAMLVTGEGLQPYRDFPLFHLPNLVFIYAPLFRAFGHPLFTARCFSVLCGLATAFVIFSASWRSPPFGLTRWRFLLSAAAILFLLFDPLFLFATGRAWNHDSSAFLIVLATSLLVQAARTNSIPVIILSALAAGLSVGSRLTCAPILLPLWGSILLLPLPRQRRFFLAAIYAGTILVALVPSIVFLFSDKDAFLFGNLEFPRLRLLDTGNDRIRKTLSPLRKLRFFCKEVMLPSLPLFLCFFAVIWKPGITFFRSRSVQSFGSALSIGVLLFTLLGCFAPSRYQYQHFFIIVPLLVLGIVYGATSPDAGKGKWMVGFMALLFISHLTMGFYRNTFAVAISPQDWFPNRIHQIGLKIASLVPSGPVLTLAPIFPLEGNREVYPEFSTGPFAWKSARFVSPARRSRFHLVCPDDLDAFLSGRNPAAILTGVEETALEKPLVEYGRAHQFNPVSLGKDRILWLPQAK